MDETDWDFLIDNEALAQKPIDNFWAPSIQARGKRRFRSVLEEEEENEGVEDEEGSFNKHQIGQCQLFY